jgi:hypothetical protein
MPAGRVPTHMRLSATAVVLALLAVATLPPSAAQDDVAPAPPAPALLLSELLPNPDPAQAQREFVEVWNPGNVSVDLAGWTLQDAPTASGTSNSFTFAAGRLVPGARIVVWSNGSSDARGPSWSTSPSKAVWNDAGDAATLLDPSGEVVDWLPYGNTAAIAPEGFEDRLKPAAPARGLSIALDEGVWSAGAPTPALAPGTVGGMAGATVLNVAPVVGFSGVPATAKPGEALDVGLVATDGNGAADLVAWTLSAGGAVVGQGGGVAPASLALAAPAFSGPWMLELQVTDAGGLTGTATATVQVRDARLSVAIAGGMLSFPDLAPGDRDVVATAWATLRNEGTNAVVPLLDVSPFTGPGGEIPVDGNLWVATRPAGGNATWSEYAGPLTTLPALAPGMTLEITLRLGTVPAPLAAGPYGTTFAVVAA